MNLLITGAATSLGKALASSLKDQHTLRLTDKGPLDTDLDFTQSQLGHDESTDELVKGIDAIVHLAYSPRDGDDETEFLDANSRRHYNLLLAAAEAEVKSVIVLSTLDFFLTYPEHMTVSEDWKPLPTTDPAQLGAHLAEFTAREFAHSHALDVVIVRLGHVVHADRIAGQAYDPIWLDERDAARAIDLMVQNRHTLNRRRPRSYRTLHLQSVSPRARFSSNRICESLDFTPQYNFEDHL
ncbi:MAG: nucleoside-diphosphate-sugar epimerase [Candidatus Latescibacterota bacterium]|jgi:nucleoside-diphosphate-sugar epimerase